MSVRLGEIFFSDWVSLPMEGGWTDTFVFRVSAKSCLPPFAYVPLIRRLVARKTRLLRPSLSLWIQVDAPGEWFAAELRRSLRGLQAPFAVTNGRIPRYIDFSYNPWLGHSNTGRPPEIQNPSAGLPPDHLLCLQALGRMVKGDQKEIASLTGLEESKVDHVLSSLEKQDLAIYKRGKRITAKRGETKNDDPRPLWHLKKKGISLALRSWGTPKKVAFPERRERHLYQIASKHRHIARLWTSWLKRNWQGIEICAGWAEVGIPGLHAIPDALAWGRIQGYETLFWLEVGDDHKSRRQIEEKMRMRMNDALQLSRRTGMKLVFALFGPRWVQKTTRQTFEQLEHDVTLVLEGWKRF